MYKRQGGYIARTCPAYVTASDPVTQHPANGSPLVVVGWKSIQHGQKNISDVLQQATLSTSDSDDLLCQQTGIDLNKQFCARTANKSKTRWYSTNRSKSTLLSPCLDPCYGKISSIGFDRLPSIDFQAIWEVLCLNGRTIIGNRYRSALFDDDPS